MKPLLKHEFMVRKKPVVPTKGTSVSTLSNGVGSKGPKSILFNSGKMKYYYVNSFTFV